MSTLEQLQKEEKLLKLKIRVAKATLRLIEVFKNREKYRFENPLIKGDVICMFWGRDNKFLEYGRLGIKSSDVKHYKEMLKICFDKKPSSDIMSIGRDVSLLEKSWETAELRYVIMDVADEINN